RMGRRDGCWCVGRVRGVPACPSLVPFAVMLLLESLPTVIGTAAVAPALLFLWLVIATDERPGPPLRVWSAFFFGAASISLLGIARAPFAKIVLAGADHPW